MIYIEWFGAITGVIGAIWLASNIASSKWGYAFFITSSISLLIWSTNMGYNGVMTQQLIFTVINVYGFYHWFIKKSDKPNTVIKRD